jgi:hypothetical protein
MKKLKQSMCSEEFIVVKKAESLIQIKRNKSAAYTLEKQSLTLRYISSSQICRFKIFGRTSKVASRYPGDSPSISKITCSELSAVNLRTF